jgi:hypothetical protein
MDDTHHVPVSEYTIPLPFSKCILTFYKPVPESESEKISDFPKKNPHKRTTWSFFPSLYLINKTDNLREIIPGWSLASSAFKLTKIFFVLGRKIWLFCVSKDTLKTQILQLREAYDSWRPGHRSRGNKTEVAYFCFPLWRRVAWKKSIVRPKTCYFPIYHIIFNFWYR